MTNDRDNARIWNGRDEGHYEVWFLTFNHRPSRTGYWIRYTLESPISGHGSPYCQLWFARFDANAPERTFAINKIFPIADMTCESHPFAVSIAEQAGLWSGGARGDLVGAGHDVHWELEWPPGVRTQRQLPSAMYRKGGLGETTYLSPNFGVPMSGTIEVDGERIALSQEPGSQMHLWGTKHAHEWAWGQACAFDGYRGATLEVLISRLKKRGVILPRLTLVTLELGDTRARLNGFRHVSLNRGDYSTGRLRFSASNLLTRVEGEFSCPPQNMVIAPYADPDGEASYCANTEIGDLRVTVSKRSGLGWREHATLTCTGNAHFEVGTRERDPAIGKQHVTL